MTDKKHNDIENTQLDYISEKLLKSDEDIWINPIGGYGDMLMISGVLKQSLKIYPKRRYKMARRTQYLHILDGHPCIEEFGYPPRGSKIIGTDYWAKKEYVEENMRAYQVMAKIFAIPTPADEVLFLPKEIKKDEILHELIPWKEKNVLISVSSESPRKMMHPMKWHMITEELVGRGALVIQAGREHDVHIQGAYSVLGLTTPKELVHLMKKVDLVITLDNFIMHAAHLTNKPAIVFFGPTEKEVYGYKEQYCIQAPLEHCTIKHECIGGEEVNNYSTECPLEEDQCMNLIDDEEIIESILSML